MEINNINKSILIEFVQEGTNDQVKIIDVIDDIVFYEVIYTINDSDIEHSTLININKQELLNFIRRRKLKNLMNGIL